MAERVRLGGQRLLWPGVLEEDLEKTLFAEESSDSEVRLGQASVEGE